MAVILGSPDDPESCLVMCQLLVDPPGNITSPGSYAPLPTPYGTFLPLEDDKHWSTSHLLEMSRPRQPTMNNRQQGRDLFTHEQHVQRVTVTRTKKDYRPLTVSGPRRLVIPAMHPNLPFTGGWRDCYVVWLPIEVERRPLGKPGNTRIFGLKHSVGALFSQTAAFDADGVWTGCVTTQMILEAAWYPGPPDELKLDLYGNNTWSADPAVYPRLPMFTRKEGSKPWLRAMQMAIAGFGQYCNFWPDYAEDVRVAFYQEQLQPGTMALEEFTAAIKGIPWVEAFDCVENAEQLAAACETLQPAEFAHRTTANKRGRDMIAAYATLRPERAEFIRSLWPKARGLLVP